MKVCLLVRRVVSRSVPIDERFAFLRAYRYNEWTDKVFLEKSFRD